MRISDWSSDVCSSDLQPHRRSHCPARRTHPAQHPGRFSHPARLPTPALNPPPKEPAMTAQATAEQLQHDWNSNPRWQGITRPYSAAEVVRLRGTVPVEHSLARLGAEKFWKSLPTEPFGNELGAPTGNQAMKRAE